MYLSWDKTAFSSDFLQDFWDTLKTSLFAPHDFYEKVSHGQGMKRAFCYGAFLSTLGLILLQVFNFGLNETSSDLGWFAVFSAPTSIFGIVLFIVASFIFVSLGLFFNAGILHLCLLILNASRRSFADTFRVVCYSRGPEVFQFVPFAGAIISGVWSLVLIVIGLKRVHQCSTARSMLAVALPLLACGSLFVFVMLAIGGSLMAGSFLMR